MRKLLMSFVATAAIVAAQPAAADTVSDWWEFGSAISNANQPPPGGGRTADGERVITRMSLAMFEASNAIDRRYESYLSFPVGDPKASQDAAIATAAYRVLLAQFPQAKASLDDSYAIAMDAIPDGAAKENGRKIGEAAAAASLTAGGVDPAIAQIPYRPRTAPGEWIGASLPALAPFWATYKPWAVRASDAYQLPAPPALNSARWAKDAEEVRRFGGKTSTERTAHQTLLAKYRQGPDLTPTLRLVSDQPGRTAVRNARMFVLYQMALDDSAQAMAVAKLKWNFWRPITAIRNADQDGNDGTQLDANWTSLLPTPNFPEYPCGHCVVAAAMAEVMKGETGPRPSFGVRALTQGVPAVVQVTPSWDEWAQEVSDGRMYGGVHYRFSNEAGMDLGRWTARIVISRVARPLPVR